jgi:ABC-type nitrate/sulfonate/bicarbonate transport system substrate-binding protein
MDKREAQRVILDHPHEAWDERDKQIRRDAFAEAAEIARAEFTHWFGVGQNTAREIGAHIADRIEARAKGE